MAINLLTINHPPLLIAIYYSFNFFDSVSLQKQHNAFVKFYLYLIKYSSVFHFYFLVIHVLNLSEVLNSSLSIQLLVEYFFESSYNACEDKISAERRFYITPILSKNVKSGLENSSEKAFCVRF